VRVWNGRLCLLRLLCTPSLINCYIFVAVDRILCFFIYSSPPPSGSPHPIPMTSSLLLLCLLSSASAFTTVPSPVLTSSTISAEHVDRRAAFTTAAAALLSPCHPRRVPQVLRLRTHRQRRQLLRGSRLRIRPEVAHLLGVLCLLTQGIGQSLMNGVSVS